jgi:hypothetical protein
MSLEMAHKVIDPQKKIMSRSFLNRGTIIVIFSPYRVQQTFKDGITTDGEKSPAPSADTQVIFL